ncbi:hypothetical protein ACIRJO_31710 [Streptomyces sp. NPDC102394]|uniref:hypothetical protein n=1 Tax=Streptomyces sp. NPDC102394 TaxID=3366167 RepID=UPI003803B695
MTLDWSHGLAGRIVVEEQQLHEPGYVQGCHPSAMSELHQLTQKQVMARPFEGDEDDFLYWLEHLLAFEGVPIWRRNLGRGSYVVQVEPPLRSWTTTLALVELIPCCVDACSRSDVSSR